MTSRLMVRPDMNTAVEAHAAGTDHAIRVYEQVYGWSVTRKGTDYVHLDMPDGMRSLTVNRNLGERLDHALVAVSHHCPIIQLPLDELTKWAFFTSVDPTFPNLRVPIPSQTALISAGQYVELPPTVISGGQVEWIRPLSLANPELPDLDFVLQPLHTLLS